jgi:hypothetical protein
MQLSLLRWASTEWLSEHPLNGPSFIAPSDQGFPGYPEFGFPVWEDHSLSHPRNRPIPRLIPGLLGNGGPSAIFWRVITVVINTVEGLAFRFMSHVGEERLKILPRLAYGYASSAISVIAAVGRLRAASQHVAPNRICGSVWSTDKRSSRVPMCDIGIAAPLATRTPTALRFSADERRPEDTFSVPALASANPSPMVRFVYVQDGPPAEPLSCDVFSDGADTLSGSHDDLLVVVAVRDAADVSASPRPAIISPPSLSRKVIP